MNLQTRPETPALATPIGASPLPGAYTALVLLVIINLVNYIDRYNLSAVLPHVKRAFFEADNEWANTLTGSLATAFMVAYMVFAPLFGWLADRMRRWWLIAFGIAVWSLATAGSGLATAFWVMFLTRCLVGIGEAAYGPAAPTLISDLFPLERRGSVIAWFYMAIPVGTAIGFMFGGFVAEAQLLTEFGIHPADRWRWAFYFMLPPGLLLAAVCFFFQEPRRGLVDKAATNYKPTWDDYLTILKNPSYMLNTLGMTAMAFSVGGVAYWMPTYVFEYRLKEQMPLDQVTFLFGIIVVVAGLFATLAGGLLGDLLRTRVRGSYFIVSGVGMLIGLAFFLVTLFVPFPYAWFTMAVAIFFLFFNTGPTNTILCNVVHASMRSTGFALNIFIIHAFGDAFSPTVIGYIADLSNFTTAFLVVSGMILLSGLLWLWGAAYLERDTQNALVPPNCRHGPAAVTASAE
ncbi:MAG: MFS transporter [Gemmatales bacterium]|nr:MFS transporter [Gemmatales bacterium]MDW8386183.1 MFS transporter [Gemmatales bacterium]